MTRIISNLKKAMMIAVLALLPFAVAQASAQSGTRVDIPFAFQANHAYLPAGHYRVISTGSYLTFVNEDTGLTKAVVLTRDEEGYTSLDHGRLEFFVSGSRHMLTNLQFAGSSKQIFLLRQPKEERVLAQNGTPADQRIEIGTR